MNQNQNFVLYRMMEGQAIQQYRLEHLLGAGGFGGVFQAAEVVRDRILRQLAIKLVSNTSDEQLNELNTAVDLDHPHFIRCFAAGECQILRAEFLFLVMELAAGSLEQQLAQGAMAEAEAQKLVQEVATALQFLHAQRKVHRDLKPGNILLAQNRWKLADFGLIRQLGPGSYGQTSNPIGTIAFMPPEAFDGKISTAWDLWSLGIMTAGVLTGKLPYEFRDETQLLKRVMNAQVQIPALPEPFGSIVQGCLNTDFRHRWTADQVLAALNPMKGGKAQPQTAPTVPADGRRGQQAQGGAAERRKQISFALPDQGGTLEFIWVPAGELVMEPGNHRVQVPEFRMGKYPITQRQYKAIMGQNPSGFGGNPKHPVEKVTWHQAVEFCQKLTEKLKIEGYEVRLPSETMWEWAARGATKSKGYTYAGSNDLGQVGWYDGNSKSKTRPVGQKTPNELGIYDLSGNVWEWCWDNWTDNTNMLPRDGKPLIKRGNNTYRAVRGGSWNDFADDCRSGLRNYYNPGYSYSYRGFRVILLPLGFCA